MIPTDVLSNKSAAEVSVPATPVPQALRAIIFVVSIAVITGMAVGYVLDQRVQYAAPRPLSIDVERAQLDVSKLTQP